jgi:CBS-domain-containing membrane protein
MLVRDFMTPNVIAVHPRTSVPDALTLMMEKRIRRLPGRGTSEAHRHRHVDRPHAHVALWAATQSQKNM